MINTRQHIRPTKAIRAVPGLHKRLVSTVVHIEPSASNQYNSTASWILGSCGTAYCTSNVFSALCWGCRSPHSTRP